MAAISALIDTLIHAACQISKQLVFRGHPGISAAAPAAPTTQRHLDWFVAWLSLPRILIFLDKLTSHQAIGRQT